MQRFHLIMLCWLLHIFLYAQDLQPVFKHLTRTNGLPVDQVTCIAQDSSGLIWFGTSEGLLSYNGFSFKSIYNKPGDLTSIPGNDILHIYVDNTGTLWILTNRSGLALMNHEGKVLQVINSEIDSAFKGLDFPYDIKQDTNGYFWCSTHDGLFKLKKEDGHVSVVQKLNLLEYGHSTNILGPFVIDQNARLWICTIKGLVIYDPAANTLYHLKNNPQDLPLLKDTFAFTNIYLDKVTRKLWYGTWEPDSKIYDPATKTSKSIGEWEPSKFPRYNQMPMKFLCDSHKNIWVASWNGIKLFETGVQKNLLHDNHNPFSIISNKILDLLESRDGNIWVLTDSGISVCQPYDQAFLNLAADKKFAFANKGVVFVTPVDKETLLVASDGLYETDMQFKIKKHFYFGNTNDWLWAYYEDKETQQVYLSTQEGMNLYNIRKHTLRKLYHTPFNEKPPISTFIPGGAGMIWMSRYRNVFIKYNLGNNTLKKYNLAALGEPPSILKLYKDKTGNLWILAQEIGLLRFDDRTETIVERLVPKPGNTQSILQSNISCMQDLNKYLFIGYINKGFSLYDKKSKVFHHYSKADGLAGNAVTDAVEVNRSVWIATTNGISRFDVNTRNFLNYNYDNGILDNNFQNISRLPDGRIVAGSMKNLIVFHPDSIKNEYHVPAPVITGINIYGKPVSPDSLLSNHCPIQISYKENYFSIEYISLMYFNNREIEYAYQLEGLDNTWIQAGVGRLANYSNLPGGKYTFRVKAKLGNKKWIISPVGLTVIVNEAFYRKTWFIGTSIFIVLMIIYALYRYRIHQLIKLEKIRTSISRDLHDEVGATLTSISIFSEMARQSVETSSQAETYIQKIGDRSRESIEKMSDIIWSINPENDSLEQMLERMKRYSNEILEAKNINVHWNTGTSIPALKLNMPKRKNMYLLFKEAVNNAAKYSVAKNVYIHLQVDAKYLHLSIIDDGIGFKLPDVVQGNGLKNIYRRALLLKGELALDSSSQGTSVTLKFPVSGTDIV